MTPTCSLLATRASSKLISASNSLGIEFKNTRRNTVLSIMSKFDCSYLMVEVLYLGQRLAVFNKIFGTLCSHGNEISAVLLVTVLQMKMH